MMLLTKSLACCSRTTLSFQRILEIFQNAATISQNLTLADVEKFFKYMHNRFPFSLGII